MDIVLASRNRKKISELETLLKKSSSNNITILSLDDIGYTDEITESAETFEGNSLIKAQTVAALGHIAVADDSGLCVDALNGAPGVYSARFSGAGATDELNNKKLLLSLSDIPYEKRTARFISVIACALPNGRFFTARGKCEGIILTEPTGYDGFGYDPLFYYPPLNKTFAQLTSDEKNSVSHRGLAMRRFASLLDAFCSENG